MNSEEFFCIRKKILRDEDLDDCAFRLTTGVCHQ